MRQRVPLFFAVALLAMAWWLAVIPTPPDLSIPIPAHDKLRHALAFAALTCAWALARPTKAGFVAKHWLGLVAIFLISNGVVIEVVQARTGRTFEWLDMLADALGVAVAVCVILVLKRHRR